MSRKNKNMKINTQISNDNSGLNYTSLTKDNIINSRYSRYLKP